MTQPELATSARSEYYEQYWHDLPLQDSPHLRWKAARTLEHPAVLAARSLIDVGCGSGYMLKLLERPGLRRVGIEVSQSAVENLRSHGIEGEVVDLENGHLPFADGTFDVALCYDVLEHLFAPWAQLREISRCLAPPHAVAVGQVIDALWGPAQGVVYASNLQAGSLIKTTNDGRGTP